MRKCILKKDNETFCGKIWNHLLDHISLPAPEWYDTCCEVCLWNSTIDKVFTESIERSAKELNE